MSKPKKPKKLKKLLATFHIAKASDFPNAPGLLALMFEGHTFVSRPPPAWKGHVHDGHD